jgi:hypothetical protein
VNNNYSSRHMALKKLQKETGNLAGSGTRTSVDRN